MLGTLRRWGWLIVCLLVHALPAQSPKPDANALPPQPADVDAALAAKPLAPSPTAPDGRLVEVLDRAADTALAGAEVFVIDDAELVRRRKPLAALRPQLQSDPDGYHRLLAAWFGTRYQTGADGTVRLQAPERCLLVAQSGSRFLAHPVRRWPDDALVLKLEDRPMVVVQVTDHRGKPAAGVPLAIGTLHRYGTDQTWFSSAVDAVTDGAGRARFPLAQVQRLPSPTFTVQAMLPGAAVIRVESALVDGAPPAPLALQLPPCGMVRVLVYDEREQPLAKLRYAALTPAAGEDPAGQRGSPSEQGRDGALFRWVPLDQQLQVTAGLDGLDGTLSEVHPGPTRAGELVVVGLRLAAANPIVRLRLLDTAGQPLAKEVVSVIQAGAKGFDGSELSTDAEGRLQFALDPSLLAGGQEVQLRLVRRGASRSESRYLGGAVVPAALGARGLQDLGDLRLAAEPAFVRGSVVDAEGKPLAGVVVAADCSWQIDCGMQSSSTQGGRIPFAHRVRTAADGSFALCELEPKDIALPLRLEGDGWLLVEPVAATADSGPLRLVAVRGGSLAMEPAADHAVEDMHLVLEEQEPPAGTEPARHQTRLSRPKTAWQNLRPGRYRLAVGTVGAPVEVLADLLVPAGGACTDPRLAQVRLLDKVAKVTVRVRGKDGAPVRGVMVAAMHQDERSGSGSSRPTDGEPVTFVFPKQGHRLAVLHRDHRLVMKDAPAGDLQIDLQPRPAVRLTLPGGAELPVGARVSLQPLENEWWLDDSLTQAHATVAAGERLVLRPDRTGRLTAVVWSGVGAELWRGEVVVPDGDEVELALPVTAEQAAQIVREAGGG